MYYLSLCYIRNSLFGNLSLIILICFFEIINKLISYCLSGYLVISQIAISNKQNSKNARGKDKTHKT